MHDSMMPVSVCGRVASAVAWRLLPAALLALHGALAEEAHPPAAGGDGLDPLHLENEPAWLPEFHEGRRQHLSAILGTTRLSGGGDGLTIGLDYEYRLNRRFGVGAVVAEFAFGDIDAATYLAVTDVHVWRGLAIQTGPGVEIVEEETASEHAGGAELAVEAERERTAQFVYRLGMIYEFEVGRLTLSPQVHYDLVAGGEPDSVVIVLGFGAAF